jgi:hypothetical protein
VAWATYPRAALRFSSGEPAAYASSKGVSRGFCTRCGTPLTYEASFMADMVDVTIASLDEPASVEPTMHIWLAHRLPWVGIDDGRARYDGFPPLDGA